jgi:hypothetical protein
MSVCLHRYYRCIEPFAKLNHPFLVTGGAKMAALAEESQQILVITIYTLDAGKAKMRITAL